MTISECIRRARTSNHRALAHRANGKSDGSDECLRQRVLYIQKARALKALATI